MDYVIVSGAAHLHIRRLYRDESKHRAFLISQLIVE